MPVFWFQPRHFALPGAIKVGKGRTTFTMACSCTATAPAGVPFTVDGTQYYVASGTYTVPALLAAITSGPNFISGAINGFRNTVTNVSIQGAGATQTINGGEALVSLYGPF